jgi:hypothetical protein
MAWPGKEWLLRAALRPFRLIGGLSQKGGKGTSPHRRLPVDDALAP